MDEILEIVKSDPEFKNDVKHELEVYDSCAIINQAKAGRTVVFQREAYRKALYIAGDVIYDQALEIDVLSDKLKVYGDYNQDDIDKIKTHKKDNTTTSEKLSRILNTVSEKMKRNNMLTKHLK